ncbi:MULTISPECIES: sigma-70 family RNA polymerase sigma factor [unclassified Acidiphilium]|jgi:RNA polymerase sigma-70 factor (ECF subfamily)|uniref:sigma-70 family RNA polymerase sigma factor n=1 Tax=unclassified Acidiphilium TaxID=2617493 RepID=UPI000BDA0571|nr:MULTISPECIES: sigma-70 family RNA polymerase sigma factor [unclassified Acidiphilium]OYV56593.1 MAG: RNA polymerase subunit sigma-70 [Acidiphilium sp. 20-67-58]HQT62022.1 sigma-70 family RNA polymerase sigma factor [Acidiphilium sp.]
MDQQGDWARWLREAQAGNRRSYEAVLRAALPWLRGMARRRFPWADAAEAEDIVQDTLLALHRNLHLYDPARPAAPFLLGILKLRGADRRRAQARHHLRTTPLDDVPVTSSSLATKETQEVSIDVGRISSAVGALPPREREILEMLKLREMSLAETSAATGMSVGALKVATFRAIRRLRAKLGVNDEE